MTESEASINPSEPWSETRGGRFIILVGMVGLFVVVFWLAVKSRQMVETSSMIVDEQYLSFGEVWEDPGFIWTVPIRNASNQPIEIAGFAMSCPCGKIEPPTLTIQPQETASVRLTLDLTSKRSQMDGAKRDFRVRIVPRIRGAVYQAGWVLRGKVLRVLTVSVDSIQFGETLVEGQSFTSRSVVITGLVRLTEIKAKCNSVVLD